MIVQNRYLIPFVRSLLDKKQLVRMTIKGSSMVPFIFHLDEILISRVRVYNLGDVVLYEKSNGIYAIHRIVRKQDGFLSIRGDGQYHTDRRVLVSSVYGRVIEVKQQGKVRSLDSELYRLAGLIWIILFPVDVWICERCYSLFRWMKK